MNNNYNYYTDYNSNNYTTTVTTIYNHVLSFHPHFFPLATKARSIATVPPPQKKKEKTPACVYFFSFFFYLLFPLLRLFTVSATFTTLTTTIFIGYYLY